MPAVPRPASVDRLLGDRRDALAVDVLHREDVDARVADRDLFAFVEIAHADEHGVRREHLGRDAADPRELRRLLAEQRRERHAVDVAAQRRRRRVHVAVRVDPQQADRQVARLPRPFARGADRSGAEAVIAAEHERHRALGERLERRLVQLRADLGDVADVLLALVARFLRLSGIGAGRSPLSTTVWPERDELLGRARRCGTPTVPCPRRGDCRRGRAERR